MPCVIPTAWERLQCGFWAAPEKPIARDGLRIVCSTTSLESNDVTDFSHLVISTVVIAILAVLVFAGIRRVSGSRDKHTELQKLISSGHYWGVRIQPGKCAAVRPFAGRRFSFEEAPVLPLSGCTAWRCSCAYVGVPDHRREERRTHKDRRDTVRFDEDHVERRSMRGRRRQYQDWKNPAD